MDLLIGTHGRAVWSLQVGAREELTLKTRSRDSVYFSRPGNMYLLGRITDNEEYRNITGSFSQNTQPGTIFCYYLRKDAEGEAEIKIMDASGQQVYAAKNNQSGDIKGTVKAGLNVIVPWPVGNSPIHRAGDYRVVLTIDGKDYCQTLHVEDVSDNMYPAASSPARFPKNEIYESPGK